MRTIFFLMCIFFFGSLGFASAETMSERLSSSFYTTPLGRTDYQVQPAAGPFETVILEHQTFQKFRCQQDPSSCAPKPQKRLEPRKRSPWKDPFGM